MFIYLYVKQHKITGLKYFGKTTKSDPFAYNGSGTYWIRHINKHGKQHIQTLDVYVFDSQELCTQFALRFSKDNNIVESKEWANLGLENGKDGSPIGVIRTPEYRKYLSESRKGKKRRQPRTEESKKLQSITMKNRLYGLRGIDHFNYGRKHTEESKSKISNASSGINNGMYGKNHSEESNRKNSEAQRGRKQPKVQCPNCGKIGGLSGMKHYHFDKCKS